MLLILLMDNCFLTRKLFSYDVHCHSFLHRSVYSIWWSQDQIADQAHARIQSK